MRKIVAISNLIIPLVIIFILGYARIKKVDAYSTFVKGAKEAFNLVLYIFPYLIAVMAMVALMRASGITDVLINILSPFFNSMGIPNEVCELVLLRPFTGSGSYALLNDIFAQYGADSYVARCASVMIVSSETIFYVVSIYFAGTKVKRLLYTIPLALLCGLIGTILACLVCKVL